MGRDSTQPAAPPRPDEASHGGAGRWGPLLLAGATVLALVLSGVDFTMSLFIGYLAFPGSAELQEQEKLGVLAGSVVSGVLGLVLLCLPPPRTICPSRL